MRHLATLLFIAALCQAQDWESRVRALRPADTKDQEAALLDSVQERARVSLAAIPHARSRAEADRARPELRRKLAASLGFGRLPWPPDLRPRMTGTLERPGYRIEKIVYQTLPGVEVPAHLYLPERTAGRAPAILFYSGHWWADAKTRPDFQAFCINMARMGFVVLAFDPFGQGERGQNNRDHRRTETLLAGVAQQGIAEYETRCALEYLAGRKEVDPKRIGMTGASGGGYNTWMTAALDDRIAAAVPVVGTSDFYEQIAVTRALDWYKANEHCHFVPGLIRYANNHELAAMIAPRPLLIVSAAQDQSFPVAGVRQVAAYARELYAAYGDAAKAGYYEDATTGHGYQQKKREAAYGWFLKWLMGKGDGSPYPEPATDVPPFDAVELRVLPPGGNRAAGPGIVAAAQSIPVRRSEPWPRIDARACQVRIGDAEVQRVMFCDTPAFVLRPKGNPMGVVVAIDDRGKEELVNDPVIREALARGWSVCGIDPAGIGERATAKMGWLAAVSLLLDDWFVLRQAADIRRVLLTLDEFPLGLYARGENAALAAPFALSKGRPEWFVLRDGFAGFRQFMERPESLAASYPLRATDKERLQPYDREIPFFLVPFRAFDRQDIPALLAGTPGLVINPIDGDWQRMAEPAARALLPAGVRVSVSDDAAGAAREFLRGR